MGPGLFCLPLLQERRQVRRDGEGSGRIGGFQCTDYHALPGNIGGVLYGLLETFWRGHTHWTMMVLAAALCVPMDMVNEHMPWELPLWVQAVLGGLAITAGELVAGVVLNLWLGPGIWNYSDQWGNLLGQICPLYAALWCLLAGPVIVGFDWLDYWLCGGERPRYQIL